EWLRAPEGLREAKPSAQEAYDVFYNDIMDVGQDKDSGLYKISISHYSPYIAQQWVKWLINDINFVMRQRAISEASQNLEYLNTQLEKTAVADMQSTFYKLIEEQTKSLMLAEAQEEFVFRTIDPPTVPEVKSTPNRALLCIMGTMLGTMLSVIYILLSLTLRKYRFDKTDENTIQS
ncbi:LPS O-antigen length regulator, partial [Vibrio harveyi]|nr:LPS O-antigen length regulator [Vibrio harveyi]